MQRPSDELLAQGAPMHVWEAAIREAKRSPHRRHKTGAVVYYGMGGSSKAEVYSTGCAHPHDGSKRSFSTHAEMHAISRLGIRRGGAVICVVTLTKNGHFATTSRPCQLCTEMLDGVVWGIVYAERATDGSWAIVRRDPKEMEREFLKPTKMNK